MNLGCNAELLSNDCPSNDTQELILSEKDKYILTMVFKKDSDKFSARNITLQYTLPDGEQRKFLRLLLFRSIQLMMLVIVLILKFSICLKIRFY